MSTTDLKSYRPGSWFGIFGERATVLLPASEKRRVAALWELVDDGADSGEVLDALIAGGLRDLPGFVLVTPRGETTQIVLRGQARAVFTTSDGETVEVDGTSASTWVERSLTGVQSMELSLEDAQGADLVISGGLVRVGRVDEPPYTQAVQVPEEAAPAVSGDASVGTSGAGPDDRALDVAEDEGMVVPVPVSASVSAAVSADDYNDTDVLEVIPTDDADESAAEEPVAEEPAPAEPEPAEPPWGGESVVEPPSAPAEEPVWGEPAAQPHEAPNVEPVSPWTPSAPAASRSPAEADSDQDQDQDQDQDEDHDGMTRAGAWDRSQFARQQPGIPGQPPAPSVTARPVARLAFSSGETVDVDRAILVGRAPEARRFSSTDQPRLVTVPSPNQEISSTHLEIRPGSGVDHGSAIVTDMGSTNGTVLVQPGLAPEDLQPGIPVQLIPGAIVDLGDGVTISVTNP